MAQTSMTVRIDSQQKAMFDSLCEQFGMSANAAINVFVKAVIRTRSIPFAIKTKESKEDKVTAEAIEAFENMCKAARENNIEMSLDEINSEIKEVRRLRKERKCTQLLIPTYLYQLLSQRMPQPQHAELSYAMKNLFIIWDAKLIKIFVKNKRNLPF